MTRVTPDQLAAWKAAEANATKGPWSLLERCSSAGADEACGVTSEQLHRNGRDRIAIFRSDAYDECWHPVSLADAAFIAIAREAVPALIAEVERLRTGVAEAASDLDSAISTAKSEISLAALTAEAEVARIVQEIIAPIAAERDALRAQLDQLRATSKPEGE